MQITGHNITQMVQRKQSFAITVLACIENNATKLYGANNFSSLIVQQIIGIKAGRFLIVRYFLSRQSRLCRSSKASGKLKE